MSASAMKYFLSLALLCISLSSGAYTERNLIGKKAVDRERLRECVVADRSWIPYPDYRDRSGWEKSMGDSIRNLLVHEGEKLLDYEWHLIKATDYLEYARSGNISVMETPYFENRRNIGILMLAELAEGKGRFIDQLLNGVFYSCEMTTWAVSAHLKYQVPKCILPDYRRPVFDLAAGDYASMLSWVYWFFHEEFDRIDPVISLRLRDVLQERALDAYMENDEWWMASKEYEPGDVINNWNPWCNSNALQCFLLLEDDPDVLADAVWKSILSVDKFLNFVHQDGACEEGSTYWTHAAGKVLDYLQLLEAGTSGEISVFDEPLIRKMGEYISRTYIGDGWAVNFADASPRYSGEPHLIYRYGKAAGSRELMEFASYLKSENGAVLPLSRGDVYRALQSIAIDHEISEAGPVHVSAAAVWYPETQVCYFSNQAGMFAAMKGGHNNESHNHNDIGSFMLYLDASPVFIDVGVGTYTRQTFSSERYSIWTMQSSWHNAPEINGAAQKNGYEYRAGNVACYPGKRKFTLDIAGAYPAESEAERWTRTFSMTDSRFTVEDSFIVRNPEIPNRVFFMVTRKPDISSSGRIVIPAENGAVILGYPICMEPAMDEVLLDDPKLANVWGGKVYRIVLTDKKIRKSGNYRFSICESN